MKYFALISLALINSVLSFIPQFSGKSLQTFEPFYDDDQSKTVIFHTAVFNQVPNYVYSELISKLNEENLKVVIPGNKLKFKNLEDDLTVVGHSSGAISAINNCKNKKVKKLILIDPIDNRGLNKEEDEDELIELNNLDQLLLLYTKKSYDWSVIPFSFPFVPEKYSLKPKDIYLGNKNTDKKIIEISKYGHGDVLNKGWADLLHNTIAKGKDERDDIYKYHKWISYVVKKISFNEEEELNNINSKFKYFKLKNKIINEDEEL